MALFRWKSILKTRKSHNTLTISVVLVRAHQATSFSEESSIRKVILIESSFNIPHFLTSTMFEIKAGPLNVFVRQLLLMIFIWQPDHFISWSFFKPFKSRSQVAVRFALLRDPSYFFKKTSYSLLARWARFWGRWGDH